MGGREPGQARDRAAISDYFHVPGVLVENRSFLRVRRSRFYFRHIVYFPEALSTENRFHAIMSLEARRVGFGRL